MKWTTLSLQVTTPLFNGGADPDDSLGDRLGDEPGIRVASIRGAMRFWFRAMAGSVIGPDLKLLGKAERRVFGGTEHVSPLMLRIPIQPDVVTPGQRRNFLTDRAVAPADCQWLIYLLGQSLGDMKTHSIRRAYVPPGQNFDLKIGFRHHNGDDDQARTAIETLTYASLWLMCAYGGAGARTRRGFGGLRIAAADGPLPGPWDAETVLAPSLAHYERLRSLWPRGPLGMCMPSIATLTGRPIVNPRDTWKDMAPTFPVLSAANAPARLGASPFQSWQEVLIRAGDLLRNYRADLENANARGRYRPEIETREWADVVHGDSERFQLGALGLPVVYGKDRVVNAVNTDADILRRASPLWLRPVGAEARWRLLSFAFNAEFLPATVGVRLSDGHRGKDLIVTDQDVQDLTSHWIEAIAADGYPQRPPTRLQGST